MTSPEDTTLIPLAKESHGVSDNRLPFYPARWRAPNIPDLDNLAIVGATPPPQVRFPNTYDELNSLRKQDIATLAWWYNTDFGIPSSDVAVSVMQAAFLKFVQGRLV